jgi:hypothetical protein
MSRITIISLPCPGEGYRTHLFGDGQFMLSIPGHSTDGGGELYRHWSEVDEVQLLFRGEPLRDMNPSGFISKDDFAIVQGHQAQGPGPLKRK